MFPRGGRPGGFERPRLVVSRCLDLEACRYNAAVIDTPLVRRLEPMADLMPVCPEVEIGLGVPRAPIRLVRRGGATGLLQPATGRDLTTDMAAFASTFLDALPAVDGFLLKARSPSCGVHGVKVFVDAETDAPSAREPGMFARAVLERFPDHPAEHEGRLGNRRLLDHFLTRLFALADARRSHASATTEALLELHRRYRRTRGTFERASRGELDGLAAEAEAGAAPRDVWPRYAAAFRAALAPMPRDADQLAVIAEVSEAVEPYLSVEDRYALVDARAAFLDVSRPRAQARAVVRSLCERAGLLELAADPFLAPYPDELALDP